jgi:hypothetical protein
MVNAPSKKRIVSIDPGSKANQTILQSASKSFGKGPVDLREVAQM